MAIKPRCLFCNDPLPWDKRSDAKYCSARCRQRAYDALRARRVLLKEQAIPEPPLDFYGTATDYLRWTWSRPAQCDACGRFTKRQIVMVPNLTARPDDWTRVCGWQCLRDLYKL